jgi:hypothetical protein
MIQTVILELTNFPGRGVLITALPPSRPLISALKYN